MKEKDAWIEDTLRSANGLRLPADPSFYSKTMLRMRSKERGMQPNVSGILKIAAILLVTLNVVSMAYVYRNNGSRGDSASIFSQLSQDFNALSNY